VPLLNEYAARFQCRATDQYPVGDHIIFVGEVLKYEKANERPLVVYGGRYALAERRIMADVARQISMPEPYPGDRRAKKTDRYDSET
jgi:flavin reductase (DIM6/NTAB) family NADH-FMN oxidoreductase RutF